MMRKVMKRVGDENENEFNENENENENENIIIFNA